MTSEAKTVMEYLSELPEERREVLSRVRTTILENLPKGYEETMAWGMLTYQVPLSRYSNTYNGKPLMYAALGSQKNHISLYLSGVYQDEGLKRGLEEAFAREGKKANMGKSCVRFKKIEDLPLKGIAESISALPVDDFIHQYETMRGIKKGDAKKQTKSATFKINQF